MSQFGFLSLEWPDIAGDANRAEALASSDPRAAAFYTRRALELAMAWLYKFDGRLKLPYQDNLSALIHEPSFRTVAGDAIFYKARFLKECGNKAVHGEKPVSEADARTAVGELFHFAFWLARTYTRGEKPADSQKFDPGKLPRPMAQIAKLTLDQLRKREAELRERDEKLAEVLADRAKLSAELQQAREAVAAALAANAKTPDTHDYNEAATRDRFIDLLLREAGWNPDGLDVAEYPVTDMPYGTGQGFVDYVLWGDDGKPLALVEAKRTRHSALKGQEQAKLYADCLEAMHGQRPVIFCSNGYEHWIWDDARYPPREVQGFYKKSELALLIQRRTTRRRLADAAPDERIVERPYQHRAIRRIAEAFEVDQRKALVVMATGAGKTRTVIALVELLMRCSWAKRVLFLADRTALVNQAVGAFKAHLPSGAPVNLLTDKTAEGRVFVSTYPTMMTLIDEQDGAARRFGPGHFDLVIVDEAHRSIYRKYRAIFDWFDSLLVGLTATPKDEIDRNTYGLFDLETGVPTDAYSLEEAVRDGYLVPMRAVSVPLRFPTRGISYDQLSEEEKEDWDDKEWGEDGAPDRVEAQAVNKWLFNADTVDKALAHLMTNGQHVEGGDRLGKSIVFARNHAHAAFIQERFDVHYPHLKGSFARVIDFQVDYAQSLIDGLSQPSKTPHLAISVDMLDTGIDVPEVVNLVFFKPVRSKTKFWQMIGRGTRLRPDLFGPGRDKQFFSVFDFCQNLEYFSHDAPAAEGAVAESLTARLFRTRLDVVGAIDERRRAAVGRDADAETMLRDELAETLRAEVAAMNVDNFIVRPKRRLVEGFAEAAPWLDLGEEVRHELAEHVAGLPSERDPERQEAKRFDLLMLNLQLCVLGPGVGFRSLKEQVVGLAAALEEQASIPTIREQLAFLAELQTDEWWQDVTLGMLENARKRLRGLVHLIEKAKRALIFTDFADEIEEAVTVALERFGAPDEFAKFRAKVRHFLLAHRDHVTLVKLRTNRQLTASDLEELERMLAESGAGTAEDIAQAKAVSAGLGLFVRSLVGLDRAAAKEAFAAFLAGGTWTANQIQLVETIIDHLTENGIMDAERLYDSPYTDFSPRGVEGVFADAAIDALCIVLDDVKRRAAA